MLVAQELIVLCLIPKLTTGELPTDSLFDVKLATLIAPLERKMFLLVIFVIFWFQTWNVD